MLFILHIKDGHPFVTVVLFLSFTGEMTQTQETVPKQVMHRKSMEYVIHMKNYLKTQ